MATVWIPALLRPLCEGKDKVVLSGATVGEVLNALVTMYPAVKERLLDEGRLQLGISIAVDGEVSSHSFNHPVRESSELSIIPAIGGG